MSATLDTSRVDAMLERLESRARQGFADDIIATAEEGAAQVSDISDPELAASVHGTFGRRPSQFSALIVSDEPKARFVFAARRPSVPAADLAASLADRIFRGLFG
jgi:hypothetical protein